MDQLLSKLGQMAEIVGEKFFLMGFVSGFIYGAWVAWSLSGKASRSA